MTSTALADRGISETDAARFDVRRVEVADDLPDGTPDYWGKYLPGYVFPWTSPTGTRQWQIRPDNPPLDDNRRPKKYLFAQGAKPILNTLVYSESNRNSIVVEGTCQSLSAAIHAPDGYNVFGIAGCNSWLTDGIPIADLQALEGTDVFVCLDADAAENFRVYRAGEQLAHAIGVTGVKTVRFIRLPGTGKAGLDDYLATSDPGKRVNLITNLIAEARDRTGQNADKPAASKPVGSKSDRAADEAEVLAHAVLEQYTLARDESGALIGRARDGHNRVALDVERIAQKVAAELYRDSVDSLIGTHAAREACFYLAGLDDYPEVTAELRSYHDVHRHRLVIDIGDDTGDVITVTGDGWYVGPNSDEELWFRRPGKQRPLHRPVPGGNLDDLRTLFPPLDDDKWSLVLGWVLAAPFTKYERPWLYFWGPRGSGKTGSAESATAVWDPAVGGKLERLDSNDLHLSVYNAMTPGFDNLSEISAKVSDFLATVVTGSTQSRRTLYTTSDESVLTVMRTGVVTGIDVKGVRPDLYERLISIEMRRNDQLVSKTDVHQRWEALGSLVLGAVLDAISNVLAKLRDDYTVPPEVGYSRFADYLKVLAAHDPEIARTFVVTSEQDRESSALENPTVAALVEFVTDQCSGDTGNVTTGDLLTRFNKWVTDRNRDDEHVRFRGDARSFGRFLGTQFGEPVAGVERSTWKTKNGRGVRLFSDSPSNSGGEKVVSMATGDKGDKKIGVLKTQGNTLSETVLLGVLEPPVLMSPLSPADFGGFGGSDSADAGEDAANEGADAESWWSVSSANACSGDAADESFDPFTESDRFDLVRWQRDAHASPLLWTGLASDGSVIDKHDLRPFDMKGTRKPRGFLVTYEEWQRRMRISGRWVEPEPGFMWSRVEGGEGEQDAA